MKGSAIVLAATILAGCSGMGSQNFDSSQSANQTLCNVMRSYEPYRQNQCGEMSAGAATANRVR
jgi:outer membrane murein-binding lipoprotein Lpp